MNTTYSDAVDQLDQAESRRAKVSLLSVNRFFHGLGRRWQVALCQLPLTLTVAALAVGALALHPALLQDTLFQLSMLVHVLLMGACIFIPWNRLPHGSILAVPLLDFAAIWLARTAAADILPGLGVLAIFPVIWLSASGIYPLFGVTASFFGPWMIVLIPVVTRIPDITGADLAATLLLPLMMLTVSLAIRFASSTLMVQHRELEEKDRELRVLLAASNKRERLLNTILETVDVGLVAVDAEGHDILMNRQQLKFHRLASPPQEPDPNESQLLVFGADRSTLLLPEKRPVRRAVRGETFSGVLVWLGEGPSQRAVSVAARPVRDGDGTFAGSVVVFSDVTDLVEAVSAKEDFLSRVYHEFRSPLGSVVGHLDLVLDDGAGDLPAAVAADLEIARRNAERLLALVSDLLSTASSGMSINPRTTDLAGLVEASVASVQAQALKAGIQVLQDTPEPLWADMDPIRIGQVLDNLLSNAVKYSAGGSRVTVRAHELGESIKLEVEDQGMGMTEAEAAQVFSKFFRTGAARKSGVPGAGLGLTIAKTIVENHGGAISCSSSPGTGSTFTVILPKQPPTAAF